MTAFAQALTQNPMAFDAFRALVAAVWEARCQERRAADLAEEGDVLVP